MVKVSLELVQPLFLAIDFKFQALPKFFNSICHFMEHSNSVFKLRLRHSAQLVPAIPLMLSTLAHKLQHSAWLHQDHCYAQQMNKNNSQLTLSKDQAKRQSVRPKEKLNRSSNKSQLTTLFWPAARQFSKKLHFSPKMQVKNWNLYKDILK